MSILITQTKVVLPRRRANLLSRQRLIDLLFDLMDYKLVIVAAPAGYGKTSLLIDFAYHSDLAICWYSVDALNRDPASFIAHFIAAIAQRFPDFGKQSLATLEANLQTHLNLDTLVATIVNEAYEHIKEHFIFVIDDYHQVDGEKDISYFISRFAQEVDENCHTILSSRTLLTLPDMPLMVARSMVGGLSFEELTFQPDEIQSLIMERYHVVLPKASAEELFFTTEGWITGLLLSTEAVHPGSQERLRVAKVSRTGLNDYLVEQVLNLQTPDVRTFLLQTSVLEEFDLNLCEAVLGKDGSLQYLFNYVLQNNLFVLPTGENGQWIRYHKLFSDFLQAHFDEENPEGKLAIQHKLIEVYAGREEWEKAYSICKELDLMSRAVLIDQAGRYLIKNGRLNLITEWIDALPPDFVAANPQLISLRAVPEIVSGKMDRGLEMLNRAVNMLRKVDDPPSLARTLSRRATVLRFMGKYWESLEDATEANLLIGNDPGLQSYQADALTASGISLYQIGRTQEAIEKWNQAISIYFDLGERQNVAIVLMELGVAMMHSGQFKQAMVQYEQALLYWREVNNTVRIANLLNNLAVLYHLLGDYEKAAVSYEEALQRTRQNHYSRMEAYILSGLGDLYADLEANRASLEAYQKSRQLAQAIDYPSLILYSNIAIASRFRSIGNLEHADMYLNAAEQLISDESAHYERGIFELEKGRLLQAKGDMEEALIWFENAIIQLENAGQPVEKARARLLFANAYFVAGHASSALEELGRALNLANQMDSQHVLLVCGIETKKLLQFAANTSLSISREVINLLSKINTLEVGISNIRKQLRPMASTIPFAPPKLIITSLGKTQVERDGKIVDVPEWQNQRKVRELFFYLLSQSSGKTKEEIGLIFWPESSGSQLKLQFKNAIYRLRHALGPDIVIFTNNLYSFNFDLDYEYDAGNFSRGINLARISQDTDQKISKYTSALAIYTGPFLVDVEGSWVLVERVRLHRMYVQAALELAEIYFEKKDFTAALEYCQSALDEEPSLEEAHRLAMRIHGARGNRAGVTRQFEQCKYILEKEIHASPSPETVSLYEVLKS